MKATDPRSSSAIHSRLRSATANAHRSLEAALDLLRPPVDRERFERVLVGFHGFHQAWEPAIAQQLPREWVPLRRLPLLEDDLRALGFGEPDIRAIPACTQAASLGDGPDVALGSVYVLEGSTLGGRLIMRHASEAPWCPPEGLRYFDPYRSDTALQWRRTLAHLEAADGDADLMVAGALRAFEILEDWLVPSCAARRVSDA